MWLLDWIGRGVSWHELLYDGAVGQILKILIFFWEYFYVLCDGAD